MLNFICPELSIFILYAGQYINITKLVESFTLSRPRVEVSSPYSWTGNLTLVNLLNSSNIPNSYFLDDLNPNNPLRHCWFRGVSQVIFYFKKRRFCTLRISEYFYNQDEGKAEVELTDILGLLDFKTAPKDYKGLGFRPCVPINLGNIVVKALQEAGIRSMSLSGDIYKFNIAVPPNKPNGSWIKFAQSYLGERLLWLYTDPFEIVKVAEYGTSPIVFSKARSQVENYRREKSPQIPADKYIVTGTTEKFTTCANDDETTNEYFGESDNGKKVLQRRETRKLISKTDSRKITEIRNKETLGNLFPEKYPNNYSMITSSVSTRTEYNDQEGKIIKIVEQVDKLLGVALPEAFKNNISMWNEAELITETYEGTTEDTNKDGVPDNILKRKVKETKSLFAYGTLAAKLKSGGVVANPAIAIRRLVKENITETWSKGSPNKVTVGMIGGGGETASYGEMSGACQCNEYTHIQSTSSREQKQVSSLQRYFVVANDPYTEDKPYFEYTGLSLKETDTNENVAPANWDASQPPCPTCQGNIKALVNISPISGSTYYERESEVSFSTLSSLTEARTYGNFTSNLAYQRYYSRSVNLPLPDEYIIQNQPFGKAHIHDGIYIIDAPNIILTENELEFNFIANYLGAAIAVPEQNNTQDFIAPPQTNLFATQVNNLTINANSVVTQKVYFYNGIPGYSINSVIFNPTPSQVTTNIDLTSDGEYITGEINESTPPGTYNFTINTEDSQNHLASTPFILTVNSQVAVSPFVISYDAIASDIILTSFVAEPITIEYDQLSTDILIESSEDHMLVIDASIEAIFKGIFDVAVADIIIAADEILATKKVTYDKLITDVIVGNTFSFNYPTLLNTGNIIQNFIYVKPTIVVPVQVIPNPYLFIMVRAIQTSKIQINNINLSFIDTHRIN